MSIEIGEVISVMGVDVTLRAYDSSNLEVHFLNGQRYKGVSIQELIAIEHGFREIICSVEGEFLDERNYQQDGAKIVYTRKLKVRPIGYFEDDAFKDGVKFLPKIGDTARLLSQGQVSRVYERKSDKGFVVGQLLKEGIAISLPWKKLFNTHVGIFGNTGSGKSNTLTKLFTLLFDNKLELVKGKSCFVFLDFNGEYIGEQLASPVEKSVFKLRSQGDAEQRFALTEDEFWDAKTLGILFQATANTQKPFLRRVVIGRQTYGGGGRSLSGYTKALLKLVLTSESPNSEALELLKSLARLLEFSEELIAVLNKIALHRKSNAFFISEGTSSFLGADNSTYTNRIEPLVEQIEIGDLDPFSELQARAELKLISDLLHGFVQYEHIQPLIRRLESLKSDLSKVISVSDARAISKPITVISLRECKQDLKKILPVLIARHYYEGHKASVSSPPSTTLHLVVDEAHNILSQQSSREAESWKDYRLELFEEIIKEGRKFGVFLTIASQRPADISPTIVSQLHNYFIHRLVNDRDLALLDNTISTLDSLSKAQIPTLPQGACVVTGTTFEIPMLIQVSRLPKSKEPDSADVDLENLWSPPADDLLV